MESLEFKFSRLFGGHELALQPEDLRLCLCLIVGQFVLEEVDLGLGLGNLFNELLSHVFLDTLSFRCQLVLDCPNLLRLIIALCQANADAVGLTLQF